MTEDAGIRRATDADVDAAAGLAAELVRMHHAVDRGRFLLVEGVEQGYARWFRRELARDEAVLLVAVSDSQVVGYAYGAVEDRDWNLLLDAHGAIHDVYVASTARRAGIGRRLVEALIAELEARGAPRILLSTMVGNAGAQALFKACGFRPTMLEMTREKPVS